MIHVGNQTAFSAASPQAPFDYAVARGFDAFEWFPDKKPGGVGWDEQDLDAPRREQIRQTARARGMRLSVHARGQANPLHPEAYRLLLVDLELARGLGAVLLNVHLDMEQGLAAFAAALRPLARRAAEAGLQLAIENTPHHSPELFNELFARWRAPDPGPTAGVGMCLDVGHANLCAATRNDYLQFLDRLHPSVPIIHLHLHENWGDADSHLPLFTGPAGRDDTGIRSLLEWLRRRHYSGSIILEQWPDPPALLDQARQRLLGLLQETAVGAEDGLATAAGPPPASADFTQQLVAADRCSRSWREKLEAVRRLLAHETVPLTAEHLVDVAIYLRFLGTGAIACVEDGHHFRPAHHARIALQIQERLAQLTAPELAGLVRRVYPWLPSASPEFQRAEPLTRIRDIAHRSDLPADLKHEIKHTLQNKLHRCAGPEDLSTSARFLQRITAPDARYPAAFVEEFRLFHEELKEFFNARSLEERLNALLPQAGVGEGGLIRGFLAHKSGSRLPEPLATFRLLTQLRRGFLEAIARNPGLATQEFRLADIGLEDYAFVLLSEMINGFNEARVAPQWGALLETLALAVENLALSRIAPEEGHAIEAELRAWRAEFDPADRAQLLRLKATVDRAGRLAEDYSDWVLKLFPGRVETLGRALGVAEHLIRLFCDVEIRGHLVFQLSKLVSSLLRPLREKLALPAWDVLVRGRAVGRLQAARALDQVGLEGTDPVVVLLEAAEGDEEIPRGVAGVILAHEIPHLSHLGVRARQAGVVFVVCTETADLQRWRGFQGQQVALVATPQQVQLALAPHREPAPPPPPRAPTRVSEVRLRAEPSWLPLEQIVPECGGGKAAGVRRLAELAAPRDVGFRTPPGLVVPFGVMEAALEAAPALAREYQELLGALDEMAPADLPMALERLRNLVRQLHVPDAIAQEAARQFGPHARLMARSSANCEDQAAVSGAGLYESVANTPVAELGAAVRQVWASLWTRAAALSRRQAGIPAPQVHMAVLVQPFLVPDYSFVLHTVHPVQEAPHQAYAEVAVGAGESLVSAAARGNPFRFLCDKQTGAVTTLAFASFSHALRPAADRGLQPETVDYSQVALSCRVDARERLGRRLAATARLVESAFRSPQDIEGAVVGDEIWLVQARVQPGASGGLAS